MSKETTLVMYLEVKYFIQYRSDVIYCLPDIAFCLRSGIWGRLWGWVPASSPLWCLVCLFHRVLNSFLTRQNAKSNSIPGPGKMRILIIPWLLFELPGSIALY